jgi:hypothetical protein
MRGAPDRSRRAIQTARTGALSRASVLRPLAAAFFHRVVRGAARLAGGGAERLESLAARPPPPASQRKDDLALVATLAASSSGHRHAKWVAGLRYPRNERPQPMRARSPCFCGGDRVAKHLLARPLPSLSFSSVRSSCTVLVVCYQSSLARSRHGRMDTAQKNMRTHVRMLPGGSRHRPDVFSVYLLVSRQNSGRLPFGYNSRDHFVSQGSRIAWARDSRKRMRGYILPALSISEQTATAPSYKSLAGASS